MPAPSLVAEVLRASDAAGIDLGATGLAWARVSATVTLVPAFGLRALPAAARGALAVALALAIAPSIASHTAAANGPLGSLGAGAGAGVPWPLRLLVEVVRGVPVALAAAIPLWGATMVGGVVDSLRGDTGSVSSPAVEGETTSLGVLFALLTSALFLAEGGASRVVEALAALDDDALATGSSAASAFGMARGIVYQLIAGLEMAVAFAAPLLVAAIVVEVAGALVARAAAPGQFQQVLAPVRALALLGVLALVVGRLGELLARWSLSAIPRP